MKLGGCHKTSPIAGQLAQILSEDDSSENNRRDARRLRSNPKHEEELILAFQKKIPYNLKEQKQNITPRPQPMSLPTSIPAAILETILAGLATVFLAGAGGDQAAARNAASHMLAAYGPENEDELRLAAHIVSFSFQALDALAGAAAPDTPVARILRLRGSAIGLGRQANKAEHRLIQLQKTRKQVPIEATPEPVQPTPKIDNTVAATAKSKDLTWTRAYEERQREARIAASLKRAEARVAAFDAAAIQASLPAPQPAALAP
jgi:hypothetical protein